MSNTEVIEGKQVVRLVIISDTHGHHELLNDHLPEGDILIHCGDFTNRGSLEHATHFADWFSGLILYDEKLIIEGNHDRNLRDPFAIDFNQLFPPDKDDNVHFLCDQMYMSSQYGVRIFGASWNTCEENIVGRKLQQNLRSSNDITSTLTTDILLTHLPPRIVDSSRGISKAWKKGSKDIAHAILKHNIPLSLAGHIHWGRGAVQSGDYTFVNASSLKSGENEGLVSPPVIIDYDTVSHKVLSIDGISHGIDQLDSAQRQLGERAKRRRY